MELCVTKGYVKHLAVSNFNGQLLMELLTVCKIKPVALQIEVHPYLPNTALVELAQKNGIIVIAHTPLMRADNLNREETNSIFKDEIILDLASKHGRTPAQIVLKSSLQRGIGVIPKTSNPARLQENFEAWSIDFSEDDLKKLRTLSKGYRVCEGTMFKNLPIFD
jgi:diketogulonate reductase-like aldo/keto reductase